MLNVPYEINIISHHPDFKNRSLKKYQVEGIETIGAWGNEPFEISFKNNTYQKIQVKISVDGTDILSGETATTEVSKDMWVVNGYDTLNLKAWPETHNGGAQFVFTSANNSVAINTHGDLSSRGIIAAAVFIEGHIEPVRLNTIHHYYPYTYYPFWNGLYGGTLTFGGGETYSFNVINNSSNDNFMSESSMDCNITNEVKASDEFKKMESWVAVGAGQHVNQKISYVQGLIKPQFSETVRVKYVWYDDLVNKLKDNKRVMPHASGFPGDKEKGINLGTTPRLTGFSMTEPAPTYFPRV